MERAQKLYPEKLTKPLFRACFVFLGIWLFGVINEFCVEHIAGFVFQSPRVAGIFYPLWFVIPYPCVFVFLYYGNRLFRIAVAIATPLLLYLTVIWFGNCFSSFIQMANDRDLYLTKLVKSENMAANTKRQYWSTQSADMLVRDETTLIPGISWVRIVSKKPLYTYPYSFYGD